MKSGKFSPFMFSLNIFGKYFSRFLCDRLEKLSKFRFYENVQKVLINISKLSNRLELHRKPSINLLLIFRVVTEQLRREAAIQRLPVTQAVSEIIKYVTEHEQEDCLLVGFSSQKVNPFREKSSCSIL